MSNFADESSLISSPRSKVTQTGWFLIVLVLLQTAWDLSASLVPHLQALSWRSATGICVLAEIAILAYCLRTKNQFLFKLNIICVIAGMVELVADWWLVVRTQTLIYEPTGPRIWESPAYMPLAWAVVLTELAYFGEFLRSKMKLGWAMFFSAVAGGSLIPAYESIALGANWWVYQNTPMFVSAPYYIILGEAIVGASFPLWVRTVRTDSMAMILIKGVGLGLWIWVAYALAYPLF
jgi:hypothetical protein